MERVSIRHLFKKKAENKKITMLSTYDYLSAKICDSCGIDCILVGDSLGMVFQGKENTLSVTLDEMIYHTKAVRRGAKRSFVIIDMPFMSYQVSVEEAVRNCGRAIKESGADAVKLEGGEEIAEIIYKLVNVGIPVVGHIGFMPQKIGMYGGYKIVGREEEEGKKLKSDFKAIESAGAFMIILETVPWQMAKDITESSKSITIGIGAGKYCDGQVLVFHDMVGLVEDIKPKFVRRYLNAADLFRDAVVRYKEDVERGEFPSERESYGL